MVNKLGGTLFVKDGIKYDYCTAEAVASLKELCDEVVLLDAGSNDGTVELLKTFEDTKTKVICLPESAWNSIHGREKLSYFTNVAISYLTTDWNINLQADEVISEHSFASIREAINKPDAEAFWVKRIDLFGDSKHYLNVPQERKPVGTEIIRLAKTKYQSIDDGQSLAAQPADWDYLNKITFFHLGFIRNKYVHTKKIKNMLVDVFQMGGNDPKVEAMGDVFDCWGLGFTKDDVQFLKEPLPKFVQAWAEERDKINNFQV